jgi:hypothetical protein
MAIYQSLLLFPYGEALNNILRKLVYRCGSLATNFGVATITLFLKIILKISACEN